jgi:hypothetical protein
VGVLTGTAGSASEAEVAAVLSALAGPRKGDAVAAVGTGRIATACLAAATGTPLLDPDTAVDGTARVVVVAMPYDVPAALRLLAPGGRLVTTAADRAAAQRGAASYGLELRHVEPVGDRVAWSAVRPLDA